MIRRLVAVVLLLWSGRAAAQSPAARFEARGEGVGPDLLERALSAPHTLVPPDTGKFVVTRGSTNPRTIIVLGRDVIVEGTVRGDVIVVGGDLYTHPGANVSGSALAFGGGVYESMLATVGGAVRAFTDFTYEIAPAPGGYALRYVALSAPRVEGGLALPGFVLPTYDRSDGLSVGVAPSYGLRDRPLIVSAKAVYRTQLGQIDPSVEAELRLDDRTTVTTSVGRATRTNERWIRSDFVNSALFFATGIDARNYYRATFAEARIARLVPSSAGTVTPYVGLSIERSRGVRPDSFATGGPWTLLARRDADHERRLRPNAPIDGGSIASLRAGGAWEYSVDPVTARAQLDLEAAKPWQMPADARGGAFSQATFDGSMSFPTFAAQYLDVEGHFVATAGKAPRQRWAFLGGSGTIATMDLLEQGGDQLVYFGGTYQVPFPAFELPYVGAPILGLRQVIGGAGVGKLPDLRYAIGARVSFDRLYAEYLFDPTVRRGHAGIGVAFGR